MTMYICDAAYNLENSTPETLAEIGRVIENPQYVPGAGDLVANLGHSTASIVDFVAWDFKNGFVMVHCK